MKPTADLIWVLTISTAKKRLKQETQAISGYLTKEFGDLNVDTTNGYIDQLPVTDDCMEGQNSWGTDTFLLPAK